MDHAILHCIEYDLSETDALEWLLRRRLQQFVESTRELWSRPGVRQTVRENLEKLIKCRTPAPGAEIYASDSELIDMTDQYVEYWANDLKLKAWVRIKVSVEEFLGLLIQQVPDRYAHNIRYFGLASPAGKHLFSSAVFTLLGEEQKLRPKPLSFEAMSVKYLGFNPLLDSHWQRMRRVGRRMPISASAKALRGNNIDRSAA